MLEFVYFCILDAKIAHREAHRVLSFFSSRQNWDSPNPSHAGECAPLLVPGGGAHLLARERGGRVPVPTCGTLYTVYVLCGEACWLTDAAFSPSITAHWTIPLTLTFERKMVMLNVLCVQECLTVVEPVKGKHCLALVLPDVEKILTRYVAKGTLLW